jgi:hypothetical protein
MSLTPEAASYQYAFDVWRAFRSATFATSLLKILRHPAITDPEEIATAVRVLPSIECRPIAFAVAMKAGGGWASATLDRFLHEFLPEMSHCERQTLEAALSRRLTTPERLPSTVETYPSRIWQRALAHQRPARLQSAAFMATSALAALLVESGCHEEDDDLDDESAAEAGTTGRCRISIADLDPVFDLVGICPADFPELKSRIFNKIVADIEAGNFELESGQDVMLRAWAGANTVTGSGAVAEILDEAERMRTEFTRGKRILGLIHSMRLGRFLIRLGMRRDAMRCARTIGRSPWEYGWQQQPLSAAFHCRIRGIIIKPGMEADRWLTDPALASSYMSVPLWLQDGICRIDQLTTLFGQARQCPWLYPQLGHVFQWHLALAGNHQALGEIAALDPEGQVGLAHPSRTHW